MNTQNTSSSFDQVGDYEVPLDPMDLLGCDSCQ